MKHRLINTTRSLALKAPALTGRRAGSPAARPTAADPTKKVVPPMPALSGEEALRHLEQTGLRDSLSEALAAARYKVRAHAGGGYEASNPKQRLRATFTMSGARVAPSEGGRELVIKPIGYGYGSGIIALDSHNITARGNRIEHEYFSTRRSAIGNPQSAIREWFVNTEAGIEHGFTLPEPPPIERGEGDALRVEMEVGEDFEARLDAAERAVTFGRGREGGGLTYDKLKVYDARERELTSRFEMEGKRLAIVVEDGGAEYPLTIDPLVARQKLLAQQEDRLTAGDGEAGDNFGKSVAISGNTAVVAANFDDVSGKSDQGSAYVFTLAGGTWTEQQQLVADDGAAGDNFGDSVAISGDTVVVGAPKADVGGGTDQGAAYVFKWDGTDWTQQQKLTAEDGAANDQFGVSVAIDGDTAVVGTYGPSDIQGAAYVFTRSGAAWTQEEKLTAEDGVAGDRFGKSVAIDGDTAVAGAPGADGQGAAYVFEWDGTDWTQQKLTAEDGAANAAFGFSVAIDSGAILVGAYADNTKGAAYVFTLNGATWTQRQKLTASDGAANDQFGFSVAISGGMAVVGASGDNNFQGAAYVFARNGTAWNEYKILTALDGAASDFFGCAVAIDGDRAVVGAFGADIDAKANQGAAYVLPIVTVNPADPNLPDGTVGLAYNQTFTASGGTTPYTFAFTGTLPAGLTLDPNGTLSGTPTADGTSTFTVEATDAEGVSGQREYTLIIKAPVTVTPTDPNLPDGAVGGSYSFNFGASGGTAPYTFAVIEGAPPAGLTLAQNGNLSGTPMEAGTFTFKVEAEDDNSATGEREYTLIITPFRT